MARIRLIARAVAAAIALLTYVWFAAVRLLPRVKRRKAARRRGSGGPAGPGTPSPGA